MDNTKLIEKFNKEIADFYEIEPLNFEVKILNSRKEIDEVKGYKTEPWVIGFTRDNTVYILAKEKWETESVHPKNQFEGALKHEVAHLYYYAYKDNNFPVWLNEGMAAFIAGQDFLCHYPGDITIDLLDSLHDYKRNQGSHEIGATVLIKLYKKFGKQKLLELVKLSDRKQRYAMLKKLIPEIK